MQDRVVLVMMIVTPSEGWDYGPDYYVNGLVQGKMMGNYTVAIVCRFPCHRAGEQCSLQGDTMP